MTNRMIMLCAMGLCVSLLLTASVSADTLSSAAYLFGSGDTNTNVIDYYGGDNIGRTDTTYAGTTSFVVDPTDPNNIVLKINTLYGRFFTGSTAGNVGGSFTLAAWIYLDAASTKHGAVFSSVGNAVAPGGSGDIHLSVTGHDTWLFNNYHINGVFGGYPAPASASTGKMGWNQVIFSYDNDLSQATIYLNGQALATKSYSTDFTALASNLAIGGGSATGTTGWLNAMFDDVYILDTALTAEQAQSLHAYGKGATTAWTVPEPGMTIGLLVTGLAVWRKRR